MTETTTKPLISPSFVKHFPEEAERAKRLSIPIDAKPGKRVLGYPVFYAWKGRVQLSGYTHDEVGPLTPDQLQRVVKTRMDRIESALAKEDAMSEQERFDSLMDLLEQCDDRYMMISQATFGGADHASFWCPRVLYEASATVAGRTIQAEGRTKTEAITALREAFARSLDKDEQGAPQ